MADFHKLFYCHSINPGGSMPFHVSPPLSFSTLCFSARRRLSSLSIFCRPFSKSNTPSSSISSPTVIVSTNECSDGSFLFKFGDPSEIVEIGKDVNDNSDSDLDKEEGLAEDNKAGSTCETVNQGERSMISSPIRCSSDDVEFKSNVGGTKYDHVEELAVLNTNENVLCGRSGTASVGIGEKEASTSMVEIRTNLHEESDGNQIGDPGISSESGMVAAIETSCPSEEEASGEVSHVDTETSQVSFELDVSSEGCDSSELIEIGENRLNVDSLDNSMHVGSGIADEYVVELPEYARLEPDLNLDEEISNNLPGDLLAAESFQNSVVVEENACSTTLSDVRIDSDIGSKEISDCAVRVEQTDCTVGVGQEGTVSRREEISVPKLALDSGVASLTCPPQALTGAEDAYFVAEEKWFIVANSVGQWSLGGMKAGVYVHELIQNCETLISNSDSCKANVTEVLKQSAATVQSPGLASLLIAHFDDEVLHVANIGDTGFILVRNGFINSSSSPLVHEFNLPVQIGSTDDPLEVAQEYQVNLDDGDVIIMATDGLFDNLYEKDIASIVSESLEANMKPKELAELLATRAQEVGRSTSSSCPFADEAHAAGYARYFGGKLDHVTVIVALVERQANP